MRKRLKLRLGTKVLLLMIVLIMLVMGGATWIAYQVHADKVDALFKEKASEVAATAVYFTDGDFADKLMQSVETDEYQEFRAEAVEQEDNEAVEAWLKDNGFYDQYMAETERLAVICRDMDVTWLYVQVQTGHGSVNLLDPDEDMLYLGSKEETAEALTGFTENRHVDPTVNYTDEYGWLCSAYEPLFDSAGKAVATIGVDIDMNDIMKERTAFLRTLLVYAMVLAILAAFMGGFFMRKLVIDPLKRLADATEDFTDEEHGFTKEHITALDISTNDEIQDLYQAVQSMELHIVDYIAHIADITAEKERIGAELNVATQIQADMLPSIFPPFPDRHEFDIFASMDPAKEVGGDFYDFFLVDQDHIALVMADVSGKGVPAALFMVIAKTLIKNRALLGESPAQILSEVNNQLCEGNKAELFVTVWLGIIQISTGKGLAANAGHEHPTLRRKGGKYELIVYPHSPAVATMEDLPFKEHEFELHPGDSIYVYTDGVAEATDKDQELYGTDRMLEALNKNPDAKPEELLHNVRVGIDEFVGDAPQFDDITMLGFTYYGEEGDHA
ncbi:MAG: SpoIIE family protein phosphatase [Lachnospiraceae bacterium]|nr:SpoIIE family protein phosphatase [Lachnospiraceae bacterium]